jgi:exosortase/archaeosortase
VLSSLLFVLVDFCFSSSNYKKLLMTLAMRLKWIYASLLLHIGLEMKTHVKCKGLSVTFVLKSKVVLMDKLKRMLSISVHMGLVQSTSQ